MKVNYKKIDNYPIYNRDAKIYSNKRFVNIDDGTMGGSHWTAFYVENKNNRTNLTHLVVNLINFHLNNYLIQ